MRPGGIDIDLRNGIRLAVDSYVNEKALARVLRALREVVPLGIGSEDTFDLDVVPPVVAEVVCIDE